MMISSISHICIGVDDLEVAKDFYCNKLGFSVVHMFINRANVCYGMILKIGNSNFLELFIDKNKYINNGLFRHVCFAVEDIKKIHTVLGNKVYVSEISRGKTDGTLQFWTEDPFGIKIEFHEYDAQSCLYSCLNKNAT
jgi:catechol 2,3-dioxygenase-like lactoylglutathione lyase family enzyme